MTRSTPSPTATTSPAASDVATIPASTCAEQLGQLDQDRSRGVCCLTWMGAGYVPEAIWQSRALRETALTRIKTCVPSGEGVGRVSIPRLVKSGLKGCEMR